MRRRPRNRGRPSTGRLRAGRPEASTLEAALGRIQAGAQTPADLEVLRRALRAGTITIASASGQRAVAIGGNAEGAVILTGDGNQVVIQGLSAEALQTMLSAQATLDPGARTEELAQLLTYRFAPLPAAPPAAPLPVLRRPLVDRVEALATVTTLLLEADVGVVTLTGPAGVGKTVLALAARNAVADRFPDGAAFISLATLTDPSL